MKFVHYLEKIAGVEIYPLLSLAVFFIFFILLLWWAFRADKRYIEYMRRIPLDSSNDLMNNTEKRKNI
ncbi:MAG: hypothetical protein FD123_2423 [Bacteroidetes bacterium]|nr:MAG: hypothetical protein FD123_2423 [Bacteroidota bacterium]